GVLGYPVVMDRERATVSSVESTKDADAMATGSGPGARADAGALAVERMLHIDPGSRLKAMLAKTGPTQNAHKSLPRQYGESRIQKSPQLSKVGRLQSAHGSITTETIAPIATFLDKATDAELRTAVQSLGTAELKELDRLFRSGMPSMAPPRLGARVALACTPEQFLSMSSDAVGGAQFEWVTDAATWQRVAQLLKTAPISARVHVLSRQSAAMKAKLESLGVDTHFTAQNIKLGSAAVTDAFSSVLYGYFTGNQDHASLLTRWNMFDATLQSEFLASAFGQAQELSAIVLLTLATVATPAQRKPHLAALAKRVSMAAQYEMWLSDDYAPFILQVRAQLTAAERAALDLGMGKCGSPELLAKLGIKEVKAKVQPGKAAPAAASMFNTVDKVVAPTIHEDHGHLDDGRGNIDESKRRKPTMGNRMAKLKWEAYIRAGKIARPELVDALRAYEHFLVDNDGADWNFSYEKYVKDDPSGAAALSSAMTHLSADAQHTSDMHGGIAEHFLLESGVIPVGSASTEFPYPTTENWQKAIGAHEIWLEAAVDVATAMGGERRFKVQMKLHAEDRYNFNPGATDIASGVPDDVNGVFEVTGLGKEFLSKSTLARTFEFTAPPASKSPAPAPKKK
ncbi:MAG: hypothetical protein ABI321_15850, partial [Polyangia bacterium]